MSANTTKLSLAIVMTLPIDSHKHSNITVQACYADIHRLAIRRIFGKNGAHGVSIGQNAANMVVSGATEVQIIIYSYADNIIFICAMRPSGFPNCRTE
jgi:hypothetical protein